MKNHFIKAGALTYAIFIMLVTLIIVGTLITIAFYHRTFIEENLAKQNLISYTNSLLTAAVNDSTLEYPWNGKSIELSENQNYKFSVDITPWGAYSLLHASASFKGFSYEKKVLCGAKGVLNNHVALFLADNNNALAISGSTELNGDCYLPKAGIKATYMEGNYYRGNSLVYGEIFTSSNKLPDINVAYLGFVENALKGKLQASDSIIPFDELNSSDYYNSFYNKTLYLVSDEELFLNNCSFVGNIVIICSKPVHILRSAELDEIMLFAPKITFRRNSMASIQAYARDTMVLGYGTQLRFPSTIGVLNKKNVGLIDIERNSRIDGNVWMTKNTSEKENKNTCFFRPESLLQGIAHIEGKVSMEGNIYGSLYTEKFFLKTVASYYENHLYNVSIDPFAVNPFFASANLNDKRSKRIIKVMEP